MVTRLGINGFGRIGRNLYRALATSHPGEVEVVAVNDLTDPATLAHLLTYDSLLGRLPERVTVDGSDLVVAGRHVRVLSERDPERLPWGELGCDVVVESTGRFTDAEQARAHLRAGARKVAISAPAKGVDLTVVFGVNEGSYDPDRHDIVSNASCTTNCVAPMAKVLLDTFGVQRGLMTTVHAYTNDQVTLDFPHPDLRRARAAAVNIIPTSTGAARAIGEVLPELAGRLDGIALRVPVPVGSVTDLVCELGRSASVEEVNDAYRAAAEGALRGYLDYTTDKIVSSDIVGSPASCTLDASLTMLAGGAAPGGRGAGSLVKVIGWYDNEWGYSNRLADLAVLMGSRL